MKKLVFTVLMTAIMLQVQAQDKKIKFGLKAGINFANATGNGVAFVLDEGEDKGSSRLGISIGGLMEYSISDKFSLQPEVLFSQQGLKEDLYDNQYEVKLKLGYINIPLMAKYYATDQLNLEIGPQLGFLTSADYYEKDNEYDESYEEDVKRYFKKTDVGINFGIGYQLKNGIGINARYNLGLTDIFDYNEYNYTDAADTSTTITKAEVLYEGEETNYTIKNRVFNISIFYTF